MKSLLFTISFATFFVPTFLRAAEEDAAMVARFEKQRSELTESLKADPKNIQLLSQRGDMDLFTAHFKEAVADYEKMIEIDSDLDAPHWRLGIAYYLAGDFSKAARQFEKYQQHESGDRENGIWHFMSNARAKNLDTAKSEMIAFDHFDREPFPALYDMFAGKKTTDEFLADVKARGLGDNNGVMFFAYYYAGIHEDLLGHKTRAAELVTEAVKTGTSSPASGGAGYMWQVARVQRDLLTATK